MLKVHKLIILFACFQSLLGSKTEEVSLRDDKEYVRLQENLQEILECRFTLGEGENAEYVTWYHDDRLAMKWSRKEPPTIGIGFEKDDVLLTRSDWHLQFAKMHLNLAGKYRCEISTSNGYTFRTSDYQLLIVDMPEVETEMANFQVEDCVIKFSWKAPPVNPRPEPLCGIWSLGLSYITTAPTFDATPYFNGSIGYFLENEKFPIKNMPTDALIRCELKITKIDKTVVQLLEKSYNISAVSERGCPQVENATGLDIKYTNHRLTCRSELTSVDESRPVYAEVKCKEGFVSLYSTYVVEVMLECRGQKWSVGNDLEWNHYDNLICVPPEDATRKVSRKTKSPVKETTSGVQMIVSSWITLLFLGITVTSGLIWGFKVSFKKKEHHHMA